MEEIFRLKEKAGEKKRLQLLLDKVIQDETDLKNKLIRLTEMLKKEFQDVQKLGKGGLVALYHSFLGDKVEKLNKEQQEYLAAKLKVESCKNELEQLAKEIKNLKVQIENIGDPETEYKNLLTAKSLRLKENNEENYLKLNEALKNWYSQKKEVNEAIDAGEMALKGLRYAIQSLRKAKNWGTFDMLGGGLLATAVKHSNIDEAKQIIQDTQVWLGKFRRELSDVNIRDFSELTVQIDSFSTFADYFFDNLIFDWAVQSRINRSLEGCETVYRQVLDLVTQLRISDVNITQKYKETKAAFNNYIEKIVL